MESEKRSLVTNELNELQNKLKLSKANPEKIILARVSYFADRELWSDALQEMYSIPNPSPELKSVIKKIQSDRFCSPEQG